MSKTYPKVQQIHSLSLLSNAAFDLQEADFATLQNLTTAIVTQTLAAQQAKDVLSDDWQLLWGPQVYSHNPGSISVVADNTMALFYNASENLFVVGIAGTNAVSMYGWMQEDFQVNALVKWSSIVDKTILDLIPPCVSAGTANGLNILLGLQSGGETMLSFLSNYLKANNIAAGAEIATAGHSLGGALSPAMAMYLKDTQSSWDSGKVVTVVSAYPTAGPTAGNAAFATYVENNLPSYTSKYNPLDVVPHAWQSDTIDMIPDLYKDYIKPAESSAPFNTILGTLVTGAFLRTINKADELAINYTQIQPWTKLEGSEFKKDIDLKLALELDAAYLYLPDGLKPYLPYLRNLIFTLLQMGYQHTKAYNSLLGIAEFAEVFRSVKEQVTKSTDDAKNKAALRTALKKFYGVALP